VRKSFGFLAAAGLMFSFTLFALRVTSNCAEETAQQTAEKSVEQSAEQSALEIPEIPVKGKVTMVDIGAKKCIPCKLMAPIMKDLEKEYHDTGRAAIHFIDVWENKEQGKKFGIRTIPTQIFYDSDGNEVKRHEGFISKEDVVAMLENLGVK